MSGLSGNSELGQPQLDLARSNREGGEFTLRLMPSRVQLSPEVLFQKLKDGAVLLDLVSEQYIGLDAVATRIWQLLAEYGDTKQAIRQMLQEYEVDEERLRIDIADFVEQLCAEGLAKTE